MTARVAKFTLGQIVRHRFHSFRGVVYDVDPVFNNTEEWYQSIPAQLRPAKNQPFYHLYAENSEGPYEAYVSEQNLLLDGEAGPVSHPKVRELFGDIVDGRYAIKTALAHRIN
jgi:heat shock protein HspQ